MAIKKSDLYSSLWKSCDELRGGMDASQYKDYVLVLLFIKYVSDKYSGDRSAPIQVPKGGSFADMVALDGKSDIGDGINKIIAKLNDEELRFVEERLNECRKDMPRRLPGAAAAPYLRPEDLELIEAAFLERVREARHARHKIARLRLWLAFLLLRYGALRLGEVLAFDDTRDIDVTDGVVHVHGAYARQVPLPARALRHVVEAVGMPEAQPMRGHLTRLDEGYLRRCLYARARECGVAPSLISARALRTGRALELARGGMPLRIVHTFLGQRSNDRLTGFLQYSAQDQHAIINYYLRREVRMKTSARNVFAGQITALRHSGILTEVTVQTPTGLCLLAIITAESCRALDLAEGKSVVATVKAPWVMIAKSETLEVGCNIFAGTVVSVQDADVATEVVVRLSDGMLMCALLSTESAKPMALKEGSQVHVLFKAFSVVLAAE